MPIYEYKCNRCDHIQEHILKLSDPAPPSCPACAEQNCLVKLISKPSNLGHLSTQEEQALAYASELKTSKGLGVKRPYHHIKDEHGHYVAHDPSDPKVEEFHQRRKKAKEQATIESRKKLDQAYETIAKGEDALKKSS